MTDPHIAVDPPIDLRAHPRSIGSDVFQRLCSAVFAPLTKDFVRPRAKRRATPPPTGKVCSVCKTWKPFDEYYPSSYQSGGHDTYCVGCRRAVNAAHTRGEPVASVRERLAARRAAERERG